MIYGLFEVVQWFEIQKLMWLELKPQWKNGRSQFNAFFSTFIGKSRRNRPIFWKNSLKLDHWLIRVTSQCQPQWKGHAILYHLCGNGEFFSLNSVKLPIIVRIQWILYFDCVIWSPLIRKEMKKNWPKTVHRFSTEIAFLCWTSHNIHECFWFQTLYFHIEPMPVYKTNAKVSQPASILFFTLSYKNVFILYSIERTVWTWY